METFDQKLNTYFESWLGPRGKSTLYVILVADVEFCFALVFLCVFYQKVSNTVNKSSAQYYNLQETQGRAVRVNIT